MWKTERETEACPESLFSFKRKCILLIINFRIEYVHIKTGVDDINGTSTKDVFSKADVLSKNATSKYQALEQNSSTSACTVRDNI